MIDHYSPQDIDTAHHLLTELFDTVNSEEALLSGGQQLGLGSDAVMSLRETQITFGNPQNELFRLAEDQFAAIGVTLNDIYRLQMQDQYDFYHMTVTASLWPKRGAKFTRLECALDFGPKGQGEPLVQTIFPQDEWREVLSWGGGLSLGLTGDLEWGAGVGDLSAIPEDKLDLLPPGIRASLSNKNKLGAFLTLPDFRHTLGRNDIVAVGRGNSAARWRIEKPKLQGNHNMQFLVVFKVPKGVTEIELEGLLVAEPDMNWLIANLRDVFESLGEKLQRLLRLSDSERTAAERLPVGVREKWIVRLPH